MTTGFAFILLIAGVFMGNVVTRYAPLIILSKKELSEPVKKWMSFIPVSIFAALVASDAFFIDSSFVLNPIENYKIIPLILVFVIALRTKSLFWSVVTGILGMILTVYIL